MKNQLDNIDIYLQLFDRFAILIGEFSFDLSTKERIENKFLDVIYRELNIEQELRICSALN